MALRTPAARAELLATWRADPRNAGRTPPVEIDPPGAHAPPRASDPRKRLVQEVIAQNRAELAGYSRRTISALEPVIDQARRELTASMLHWMERGVDGELRWTAQSYRAALAQMREMSIFLGLDLRDKMKGGVESVEYSAVRHVARDLARFSEVFDHTVRPVQLDVAKQVATGRSFIIPRIETSAKRYGRKVYDDIQRRLAVDLLKGAPVHETMQRLVDHGGPRGLVALRGVAGEENAVVEYIGEGLFKRYRYFAERIVRTEYSAAYGEQTQDSLRASAEQVPGLMKCWMVAPNCCLHICAPLDGAVVGIDDVFESPVGSLDHNPAHPNCLCTCSGWCARWGTPPRLADSHPMARAA